MSQCQHATFQAHQKSLKRLKEKIAGEKAEAPAQYVQVNVVPRNLPAVNYSSAALPVHVDAVEKLEAVTPTHAVPPRRLGPGGSNISTASGLSASSAASPGFAVSATSSAHSIASVPTPRSAAAAAHNHDTARRLSAPPARGPSVSAEPDFPPAVRATTRAALRAAEARRAGSVSAGSSRPAQDMEVQHFDSSAPQLGASARVVVLEAELREAGALIADLGRQLESQAAAVQDNRRRREAAEETAQAQQAQHEERQREWEAAALEMQKKMEANDAAAKEALRLREAHHEEEKREMLNVYQELVADVEKKQHDVVDGRLHSTAANSRVDAIQTQHDGLLDVMLSQRSELRQRRWDASAEGAEEYHSLIRKLDTATAAQATLQCDLDESRAHVELLTNKLRDADLAHEAVSLELSLLQEEYNQCTKVHAENIRALQAAHETMRGDDGQADRARRLAQRLKESEDRELQLRCEATEMREELAFAAASKGDDDRAAVRMREEMEGLQALVKSMEGGWKEMEELRVEAHDLRAQLDAAKQQQATASAHGSAMEQRVSSISGEHHETRQTLQAARRHLEEVEDVLEDYNTSMQPLRQRVGVEGARPVRVVVDRCLALLDEKDVLLAEMKRVRAEQEGISSTVATMDQGLRESQQAAEQAKRELREEKLAHEALRENIEALRQQVQQYERRAEGLEARATEDRRAASEAKDAYQEAEKELIELRAKVTHLQAERDDMARDTATLRKDLIAKASLSREEGRHASTSAILDLQALAGKNRALQALVDTLECDLRCVRSAVLESLQVIKQQQKTNDHNKALVAQLRTAGEHQQGVFEEELHHVQKELTAARLEVNALRQSADAASADLLDAKRRLRDADRLHTEHAASQSLVQTYQLSQQEARREVDLLLNQKHASDEELARASELVKELRAKLGETRAAQQRAMNENSSLTTQLCATRQDAQSQQRRLLDEVQVLRRAVSVS